MIKDCLSAAGITSVVWIDDFFSAPSRDDLGNLIVEHLHALKEKGVPKVEVPPFASIDLSWAKARIEEVCYELFEELDDIQIGIAEAGLASAAGKVRVAPLQPDLSPEQFSTLQKAFGKGLQTYSLNRWTAEGETKFIAANESTLFLIDKEFSREAGAVDGTQILRQIVKNTSAFCVILTHTCKESDQDGRRIEIAKEQGVESHRFCVLSKQQTSEEAIDPRFARAIYAVMTHRFTGEIAESFQKAIKGAIEQTAIELTRQSVLDLDRALFENSYEEGVLEFDVVRRIFHIEHRDAVNKVLQDPTLQQRLRAARQFRKKTGSLRAGFTMAADMNVFREWRKKEVFEDGQGLNQIHAPLTCGDVFESDGTKPDKYVFLAQPCDLMVRQDGRRRAEIGLLVLVSQPVPKAEGQEEQTTGHRFFDIAGVFGAGIEWKIDFQNTGVVDLSIMDFCVFNADGRIRLKRAHPEPDIVLAGGWTKRLTKALGQIFPDEKPSLVPGLGLGKRILALQPTLAVDTLTYPLRRIGRLESYTANAILAGWATFQTRAALEHDFADAPLPEPVPLLQLAKDAPATEPTA